jgi:hypothetical protein
MATYTIIPRTGGDGFDIGLIGENGARQTMLGFATETDAEAWIESDRRLGESDEGAPVIASPGDV